jgi:hypothetical protein
MDEVVEFCRRVLGAGVHADEAIAEARSLTTPADRVATLAAAARACRVRADIAAGSSNGGAAPNGSADRGEAAVGLAEAVDAEMEAATAALPERHREALALRESLRLSHEQVAKVMGIDAAAVAPLLARARLALREQRRGAGTPAGACTDRDRALRSLARRQDSEPLTGDDDDWLLAHLGTCEECDRAHAAMLEASVCYRAWSAPGRSEGEPSDATTPPNANPPLPASPAE